MYLTTAVVQYLTCDCGRTNHVEMMIIIKKSIYTCGEKKRSSELRGCESVKISLIKHVNVYDCMKKIILLITRGMFTESFRTPHVTTYTCQ